MRFRDADVYLSRHGALAVEGTPLRLARDRLGLSDISVEEFIATSRAGEGGRRRTQVLKRGALHGDA